MEKTLTIDGRQVRFKSTAATPMRYKAQFGKDFFAELMKLVPLMQVYENADIDEVDLTNIDMEILQRLDFEVFYNIVWVLAKTADKGIPEPIEWLDGFSEFPLMEILPQLNDLISKSFQGKKNENHPAIAKM